MLDRETHCTKLYVDNTDTALAAFASWWTGSMARMICQLYDILRQVPEMTRFRGRRLVYCRHYVSEQTHRFIAEPLGRLGRLAAGLGVLSDMVVVRVS